MLFIESSMSNDSDDDGSWRSEKIEDTQGSIEGSGKLHFAIFCVDTKVCLEFFFFFFQNLFFVELRIVRKIFIRRAFMS